MATWLEHGGYFAFYSAAQSWAAYIFYIDLLHLRNEACVSSSPDSTVKSTHQLLINLRQQQKSERTVLRTEQKNIYETERWKWDKREHTQYSSIFCYCSKKLVLVTSANILIKMVLSYFLPISNENFTFPRAQKCKYGG